jgi:hypothetical protein
MDQKDWLSLVTEEYKSARQESLDAGNNAQSILRFGIATIGIVISAGFNLWDKSPIPDFVFLVFNPILCYLILTMWIGEFARRIRVGHFIIQEIEKKVNSEFPNLPPAIIYESWIRKPNEKGRPRLFKWNRYATIALFLVTAICSIGVGNYKVAYSVSYCNLWLINTIEFLVFAAVVIFNYSVGRKLK